METFSVVATQSALLFYLPSKKICPKREDLLLLVASFFLFRVEPFVCRDGWMDVLFIDAQP